MRSLAEVVSALQSEIGSAFAGKRALNGTVRLEPERVVVTLQFTVETHPNGQITFDFDPGKSERPTNNLSLEFNCRVPELSSLVSEAAPSVTSHPSAALKGSTIESLKKLLEVLFGAPGFDSSARATVFREAFENLSDSQADAVLGTLTKAAETDDATVKRSKALLDRVCKASPAGEADAKKILTNMLAEFPLKPLLQMVAADWKSQENWMS